MRELEQRDLRQKISKNIETIGKILRCIKQNLRQKLTKNVKKNRQILKISLKKMV